MSPRAREPQLWLLATITLVASAAAAFWIPALRRAGGHLPVPLDDVYIHFGFARSAALGHPFSWIPGNGYSSGGTSLTYPLALAPGWLLGLRGERLALFAALLACASLVDLARSLRALAPDLTAWLAPALLLSVPRLDWSLFSGMEIAFWGMILGRALLAVRAVERATPGDRARRQIHAGLWAALLIATRPESAPLALLLSLSAVHAAGSLSAVPSLARTMAPPTIFLAGQALVNRALTGEWSAAGAVRKLASANPYTTPIDVALEVIRNLAAIRLQAFEQTLGGPLAVWILPLLGLAAVLDRRSRRLALPLLLGAIASIFLVSLNTTARFQNYRYVAPAWLMLLAAAALGASAIARRSRPAAALALGAAILAPAGTFAPQIDHFARASANIAGQQVEVAARLAAREPKPRRVMVGDAGAIPYLSGLPALDGLGLGGYHDLPFARASVHGIPSVLELIERLEPAERPDVLALYPSWWPGLADVFGKPVFSVRIEDNVICGAEEKVVYDADWSALAPPGEVRAGEIDAIDVADLVDERLHGYQMPAPRGGWVIGRVLPRADGTPRFDGGRILPEGQSESFAIRAGAATSKGSLVIRTDGGDAGMIRVTVEKGDSISATREVPLDARNDVQWHEITVPIGAVSGGERVRIFAVRGAFRSFHSWVLRE